MPFWIIYLKVCAGQLREYLRARSEECTAFAGSYTSVGADLVVYEFLLWDSEVSCGREREAAFNCMYHRMLMTLIVVLCILIA